MLCSCSVNFSSFFASKSNEDKTRISSFERVCFIIYSGEVDKYMTKTKIKSLLEKIREVLKDESQNRSLFILVFFILRVLILRLSPTHLSELFRNIWPILLTLLVDSPHSDRCVPAQTCRHHQEEQD